MNLKAILFDLDGVLVRSEHLYEDAKKRTLLRFGIDSSLIDVTPYYGQTDYAFFVSMKEKFPELSVSAEDLARSSEGIFRDELATQMKPMPGASDFIRWVHSRNLILGNVTSATAESQRIALNLLNVKELISVKVNANTVSNFKPHPEPYLQAINSLGFPGGECLAIEDTKSGVRSAKSAGLIVAGFGDTSVPESLLEAGADFYVRNYSELKDKFLSGSLSL